MDQTPDSKQLDASGQATTGTAEPAPRPPKRRLRWLVLAYVAVCLSTLMLPWRPPPNGIDWAGAFGIGVIFCQTGLLGIWSGLGTSVWWVRLLGLIAGMVCLATLLDLCTGGPEPDNHLILALATVLVVGMSLIVRCFRVRICLTPVPKTAATRFQFSIRQLLILTFAVACLVPLGKWLGPDWLFATEPSLSLDILAGVVLGTVGVISIWPALGTRHPILPCLIVTTIAAGLGFCVAKVYPSFFDVTALWMTLTSVEAVSLVASLLVVRACGYRLVRLPYTRP